MSRVRSTPIQLLSSSQLTAFTFAALSLALTILVALMCQPIVDPGVGIDLPRVNHPRSLRYALREDASVVAVMRNGDVFFGNDKLPPDMLGAKLRESLPLTRERKVYIRADARAPWSRVADVIDGVQAAGVGEVAFFADQRNVKS